jgi:nitrite reductase/ring-hydroxylating ferredoxin subunit
MKEELVRICASADVEPSRPVSATLRGIPYVVVRDDATVRGYVSICAHKDIAFVARGVGDCIECPLHGVCFDARTGAVVDDKGRQVPSGLEPADVDERDGEVFVRVVARHRDLVAAAAARRFRRALDRRLGPLAGLIPGRR